MPDRQFYRFMPKRRAFSLAELLIVIGIILLVMILAVPAFNFITGARSIEAADNTISAALARARLIAIRDQAPRGLVFYRDVDTDRVAVAVAGLDPTTNALDVVAGTDVQFLPRGVGIALRHQTGNTYVYRLGNERLLGAIMFDAKGHMLHSVYTIFEGSVLGKRLGLTDDLEAHSGASFYTQPAYMLFESAPAENSSDYEQWVDENATVYLVNRYNGTVIRSE